MRQRRRIRCSVGLRSGGSGGQSSFPPNLLVLGAERGGRIHFLLEKTTRFAQTSFFLPENESGPRAHKHLWDRQLNDLGIWRLCYESSYLLGSGLYGGRSGGGFRHCRLDGGRAGGGVLSAASVAGVVCHQPYRSVQWFERAGPGDYGGFERGAGGGFAVVQAAFQFADRAVSGGCGCAGENLSGAVGWQPDTAGGAGGSGGVGGGLSPWGR